MSKNICLALVICWKLCMNNILKSRNNKQNGYKIDLGFPKRAKRRFDFQRAWSTYLDNLIPTTKNINAPMRSNVVYSNHVRVIPNVHDIFVD